MDSQDQRSAVSRLVSVLRRATRAAQLAPFAYLGIYTLYMLFGSFVADGVLSVIDSVITAAPIITVLTFVTARPFRLCIWHKIACTIPLLSHIEGYIDSFIITFTQEEVIVINTILGIASLVFIILAIRRFTYGRKAVSA